MEDSLYDFHQLSREDFRCGTYNVNSLDGVKIPLAKAGFYYTRNALKVKCFSCGYELDASQINPTTDVLSLHKSKEPNCRFIEGLDVNLSSRSKKFLSYDNLRYEKERRATFIEWPIYWLSADDLAADGFYYLRTKDHCACVFCRGIVGEWEVGDTPRGEHQRHFPHCPFIQGQPVGNVPITQSSILDGLPLDRKECPLSSPRCIYTVDKTGTSSGRPMAPVYTLSGRHMTGSYAESKGPKRKDYITKESREQSFSRWPERVVQKPSEMAEAGFFYCGLSDHVRCFHCGCGLRNWEIDDKPWEQHARWYPECNFVLLSKGREFIDKVRRENPPYLHITASKESKPQKLLASSGQFKPLNDKDLENLMHLDIMQAMSNFGFPIEAIRKALRRKLEQTGLPFFSLDPCIKAVQQIMEEETRQAVQQSRNTDVEAVLQNREEEIRQAIQQSRDTNVEAVLHILEAETRPAIQQSSDTDVEDEAREWQNDNMQASNVESQTNSAVSPSTSSSASASSSVAPVSTGNAVAVALPINTNSSQEGPAQSSTQPEAVEIDEQPETEVLVSYPPTETQTSNVSQRREEIMDVCEISTDAGEMLNLDSSSPPSIEINLESVSATATPLSQDELERLRDSIACKLCMDAEFNVVFLPCKHMGTCVNCAAAMIKCPFCRADIEYLVKVEPRW